MAPRTAICAATGTPPCRSTNCGSTATNSIRALGLRPLVAAPRATTPNTPAGPAVGAVGPDSDRRDTTDTPSQIRYAAPTSVTAVRARGLVTISTASPAATATVRTMYPATIPATAGRTIRSRNPTAITYAQSGPGVSTSTTSIVRNAATAPGLIVTMDATPGHRASGCES